MTMIGVAVSPCAPSAVSAWSPLALTPSAWWNPTASKVALSGSKVTDLLDSSPNGCDLTQGVDAKRLTYDTSGARPKLVGTGTQFLARSAVATNATAYTILAVVQAAAALQLGDVVRVGKTDYSNGWGIFLHNAAGGNRYSHRGAKTTLFPVATTNKESWCQTHDGGSGAALWWVGGSVLAESAGGVAGAAVAPTTATNLMGTGTYNFNGSLWECVIVPRVITPAERASWFTYTLAEHGV